MESKKLILLAQDEPAVVPALGAALLREAEVSIACDVGSAISMFGGTLPDLVIVAWADCSESVRLCTMLRGMSAVPIMLLTEGDVPGFRLAAFRAGAEIVVPLPAELEDILAQVRAVLRRSTLPFDGDHLLRAGDVQVDLKSRRVIVRGRAVRLTPKEFDLLVYIVRHRGEVLTHTALLRALWGSNYVRHKHYLHVLVRQLRAKIEPDPSRPVYIETEPCVGYRFNAAALAERLAMFENDLSDS